ncbi:hypothetical protein D3C77_655960 [compost metagenome]
MVFGAFGRTLHAAQWRIGCRFGQQLNDVGEVGHRVPAQIAEYVCEQGDLLLGGKALSVSLVSYFLHILAALKRWERG